MRCTHSWEDLEHSLRAYRAVADRELRDVDGWIGKTEVGLHDVRLQFRCGLVAKKRMYQQATYDVSSGITFARQVERSLLETGEHLDKILQKAHLCPSHVNISRNMNTSIALTKSRPISSSS